MIVVVEYYWHICLLGLRVSVTGGSQQYVISKVSTYLLKPLVTGRWNRDLNGKKG
jgi:hypothetical protein